MACCNRLGGTFTQTDELSQKFLKDKHPDCSTQGQNPGAPRTLIRQEAAFAVNLGEEAAQGGLAFERYQSQLFPELILNGDGGMASLEPSAAFEGDCNRLRVCPGTLSGITKFS